MPEELAVETTARSLCLQEKKIHLTSYIKTKERTIEKPQRSRKGADHGENYWYQPRERDIGERKELLHIL